MLIKWGDLGAGKSSLAIYHAQKYLLSEEIPASDPNPEFGGQISYH